MLLNLNDKFKFFLTTTLLFSSPETLAVHLSVLIDDKESPIYESLIIKDVIAIGAVPSYGIKEYPEFNGGVNGISVTNYPEFTGGVNDMDPPIHEISEYKGCITDCDYGYGTPDLHYPHHDYDYDYDYDDGVPDVVVPKVRDLPPHTDEESPNPPYMKGTPEIHSKIEFTGSVNGIPDVAEPVDFEGGVNGDKDGEADFQDRLPVVTYVSITAVPSNAPIMDKPEYIGVVPSDAPVIDKPEYIGVVPSDAPVIDKPEYIGVVPSDVPVIDKPEYIGVNSSDLPVTNKTKYVEPRQSLSKLNEENNGIL